MWGAQASNESTSSQPDSSICKSCVPSPAPDEVLVELKYSGLCHSDIHAWKEGHEGTGIVTAIGSEVEDIKVGDHVGVQWVNKTCGVCEADKRADFLACSQAQMTGFSVDGTFGTCCVIQARHAVRIPKEYPLDTVAPIICAGTTCFRAVEETEVAECDILAVVGPASGIGSLACQYAKAHGCRVLAISTGGEGQILYKDNLRVDFYVDYHTSQDIVTEVRKLTVGGPDAAIMIEGTEALLEDTTQYVRPRGSIVVVGKPPGKTGGLDMSNLLLRMGQIKSSPYGGSREQIEKAIDIFIKNKFYQPSHVISLDELPQMLQAVHQEYPENHSHRPSSRYESSLLGQATVKIPSFSENTRSEETFPKPTFYQESFNISTYIAYRLEELGIRDFLAVPGDTNLVLLDNLLKNPNLRMIGCCNELNAGYAADGYARTSPANIAVLIVPYVVGALSALNAVAGACSQNIKIIVLSGCPTTGMLSSRKFLHHAPSATNREQALDAYQGVTAASIRLQSAETAVQALDDAISKCLASSLPIFIEVPNDIAGAACSPPSPFEISKTITQTRRNEEAVNAITGAWNKSEKPVLLFGSLARRLLPAHDIEALADRLCCAVFCQPDGRCISESHPQYCGQLWNGLTNPEGEKVFMNSDLWLVVGANWCDFHGIFTSIDEAKSRMISIGKDWVELPDETCFQGIGFAAVVRQLTQSSMEPKHKSVPRPKPTLGAKPPQTEDLEAPLTLEHAMYGIQNILRSDDTMLCDAGEAWFLANHIRLPPGTDCQIQMPYCSIGWALPAGLGAQLARSRGRSIILIGDGGFQMTAQEVSTIVRQHLNPIIIIFNNLGYKIETTVHDGPYNYIANWNYSQLAASLSASPHASSHNPYATKKQEYMESNPSLFTLQVKTQRDLEAALKRAYDEHDKLAFLELCIQPDDLSQEVRRLGKAFAQKNAE
ncbi:thiamine diphosphate-binding protein [Aspergillus fijiensis CBS 313.89]|uniref:Pyruvate decarboxylase n=1 Tax=Aspergillus fijiensis CBS 313.89 TaxID=1448319 RepID=A0A8G1RH69_9EURO|nr:thiamine diphosphate-binding protein [Aspergillus fijiensis CBS 313.89]RAK72658.1 thiamine diphosphate-binding protein [Aspergillus fijiensis CBS 313.89]